MSRTLLALVVLALGVSVSFGQGRAAKLARIQKKFDTDEVALQKKLADAKEADEKQQIAFLIKELHAFAADDAIELAEEAKKDEAAVDACVFALKLLGKAQITGEKVEKAANILLEHHVDNPKIQPALELMSQSGYRGEQFLKEVGEKAMNKDVKALTVYYGAFALDAKAFGIERQGGPEENVNKLREEAADQIEKAVKAAPDAKVGDSTLAKVAEIELLSLRIGVGKPAPEIEGTDLNGKKVELSSYRGKVVLFDFWATWCGPCVAMIPHERDMVKRLSSKPFVLLSVNVDADRTQFDRFLAEEKMPWEHWVDGQRGPVSKMYRVRAFPTLFLIDAKGIVRKKYLGVKDKAALDKAIDDLVAEAEKK